MEENAPNASYDQPFHASTSDRLTLRAYTDPIGGVCVKKFAISPDAVIHHDEGVSYASGGNTDEAVERARAAGADATLHTDSVMQVYNAEGSHARRRHQDMNPCLRTHSSSRVSFGTPTSAPSVPRTQPGDHPMRCRIMPGARPGRCMPSPGSLDARPTLHMMKRNRA